MKVRISIPGAVVSMELEDERAVKTFRELAGRLIGTEPAGAVKIKPPEVLQEKVKALVDDTIGSCMTTEESTNEDELAPAQSDEPAEPAEPIESEQPNEPAEPTEPLEPAEPMPHYPPTRKYKGFLYIQCEKCQEVKGFCPKEPISVNRCKCGYETELKDLVPLWVHCECGKRFKYMTNMDEFLFDINCIECGSPVPVKWNKNKRLYETIK